MASERSHSIDLIRGGSALAVVAYHYLGNPLCPFHVGRVAYVLASPGWFGVEVFFVLSGCLLGGRLLAGQPLGQFYLRRASRTLPLYVVLLAWTAFFAPRLLSPWLLTMTQNISWAYGFGPPSSWLIPTWSLAVEEQFYLLLPLLILLVRREQLPIALLALAAGGNAMAAMLGGAPASLLLPCRWDALLLGVALAAAPHGWQITLPRCWPVEAAGRLCYPIYLFHCAAVEIAVPMAGRGVASLLLAINITLLVSVLLHRLIELPMIALANAKWPTWIRLTRRTSSRIA